MKTNRNGRECPGWCTRDHADPDLPDQCAGGDRSAGPDGEAGIRWLTGDHRPEVVARLWDGPSGSGVAYAHGNYEALELAKFLEAAADTAKPVLRQMAAHVRQAAAEAYPEAEAS